MLLLWCLLLLAGCLDCYFFDIDNTSKLKISVYREKLGYFRMMTHIPREDLPVSYSSFSDEDLDFIYVGARDYLYKFKLGDISKVTKQHFPLNSSLTNNCLSIVNKNIDKEVECNNQVWNVMYTDDHRLMICESQAFQPKLRYVDIKTMEPMTKSPAEGIEGDGYTTCDARASKSPGNIFSHQFNLNNKSMVLTYIRYRFRMDYDHKLSEFGDNLRVYKNSVNRTISFKEDDMKLGFENNYQILDGVFIRTMIIGDFVYIFFTEITNKPAQFMNPDIENNRRVTRVSRFCKTDVGFDSHRIDYITSFTKATMTCTNSEKPGFEFKYNLMKDVTFDSEKNEFIAIFSTRDKITTALCTFSLDSVNTVLSSTLYNSRYKYKDDSLSYEINRDLMTKEQCPGTSYSDRLMHYSFRATVTYADVSAKLLYAVKRDQPPLLLLTSYARVNSDGRDLYAFDADDRMCKFSQDSGEDIKLVSIQDTTIEDITDIKIIDHHIYGISDTAVFSVDVLDQCTSHTRCSSCTNDANCMWNKAPISSCVAYDSSKRNNYIVDFKNVDLDICLSDCQISEEIQVAMVETAVVLAYTNKCTFKYDNVRDFWYIGSNSQRVQIDDVTYSLTTSGSLIVLSGKSSETFTLKRESRTIKTVKIIMTECTTPSCHFRQEFSKWCQAFSTYKKDYSNWRCLKDTCTNDPTCIPKNIPETCAIP